MYVFVLFFSVILFDSCSLDDLTKSEANDFQLLFAVSTTDNDSYLWKAFVRVSCCKVSYHVIKIMSIPKSLFLSQNASALVIVTI